MNVLAQSEDYLDHIHVGIYGGYHLNKTSIPDLDGNVFPDPSTVGSGVFGIFSEFELGQNRMFSIRPELAFLSRITRIEDISYLAGTGTGQLNYELNAKYVDIRVPLMLNFGNPDGIRPYFYVAPILGFATGGKVKAYDDVDEYAIDASKASLASMYVAGAVGVGVKFPIPVGNDKKIHLALDASYEYGFTDTYGTKEKDGEAYAQLFWPVYDITDARKFSGFEVKGMISIPLSIFRPSKHKVVREIQTSNVEVEEKPCYTLDEILNLIALNQSVEGKTICAIDVINFEFGKHTFTRSSCSFLDKIAALMISTNIKMEVRGHTDNVGSDEYNMELSRERAKAVYDYLISKGVSANKLSYAYFGMRKPISTNDTEEGRKQNRRVEFRIMN